MDNSTASFSHMTSTISLFTTILACFYCLSPNKRYARKLFPTKKPAAWNSLLVYQQALEYMVEKDYFAANPCSKEPANKKEYLETYKETHNSFKIIETITQIPEILSIINYADTRPAPHEIGVEFYTGLRNPYYSFPQNYRFGFDPYNGSGISENSTIAEPLLIEQHLQREIPQKKPIVKSSEMVPSSLLSNSGAINNDKLSYGSQSVKGVSLLRDLKMIPSVNSNNSHIEFDFHEVSSEKGESYQLPAFGGAESVNVNQDPATGFTLSSHDAAGMLEGISPITGASLQQNLKGKK